MADVRFAVLGRVGLTVDGVDVTVPGRRERAVLAMLLAARGEVVTVDRLVDDLWGESPGTNAQGSLQVAVSRLRALLEPGRAPRTAPAVLVSSGPGYALRTGPEEVDADRFVALATSAHAAWSQARPEDALQACAEADLVWTGTPFADAVDSDLVRAEQRRLEDLRAGLHELRAEARLALGGHALATSELEGLVTAYPFRERLWSLYALALYRSSRQSDALEVLRRARTLLREELGVDPSRELQQLETDVLTQAPGLTMAGGVVVPAPHRPVRSRHAIVGREDALDVLISALDDVRAGGGGRAVVVSGEAGIGKTRLVTELAERADGARLLRGRCHDADVSPAYWPWLPVVRAIAGRLPPREVVEMLEAGAGDRAGDAGPAALRTHDAVAGLVVEAARERPLLLLLEDVHWADTASLQLLAYLAEAVGEAPVLLVVTVRTTVTQTDALRSCLASLARAGAQRLVLRGLASDQVRELVACLTGSPVARDLAEVVAERTDGNPFFVIELVRLLTTQERLDAAGAREVAVPHGVQDVLALRLAPMPQEVRVLLRVAAVVGRGFQIDVVAEVAGRSIDETVDLLDVAVSWHAVEEADAPGRYRFTHALVRETLYGGLSLARRGLLHAAVARALEPRLPMHPDLVAEVAHHFVLGATMRPELADPAVRHSIAAARLAEARGALDQALVHWEDALSADARAPHADARRRYDVLLGLGQARSRRGDVAGSREALGDAMEVARGLADRRLLSTAATSFRGAGVWHWREFGTSDPTMLSVLDECVNATAPGPLRIRALVSMAMELVYEWRSVEAEEVGWRAVSAARAHGDQTLLADVVSLHTLALWGKPGAVDVRLELAAEALAGDLSLEQELQLRFGAASAHLQAGRSAEAGRQMSRCVELARRLRHSGADVPIAWWRFYRAIDAGDTEAAGLLLTEALERHRHSSVVAVSDMEPMARLRLGGAGTTVPDECLEAAHGHANPAFRAVVGHALAESGRAAEGAALLGEPVPDTAWDYASTYGDCLRVDVLASAGLTDRLPEALARIRPWGHEFAVYGSTDCIGSIDHFVGRGLEALGDLGGARAAYRRAAEVNRAAGIRPWLARAEERLAGVAR